MFRINSKLDRNSQKLAVCNEAPSTAAPKKMQSIMNLETKEKIGIFVMKFNFTVYEIWAPSSSRIDDATRKLKVWIIGCAKLIVDFIVSRYQH